MLILVAVVIDIATTIDFGRCSYRPRFDECPNPNITLALTLSLINIRIDFNSMIMLTLTLALTLALTLINNRIDLGSMNVQHFTHTFCSLRAPASFSVALAGDNRSAMQVEGSQQACHAGRWSVSSTAMQVLEATSMGLGLGSGLELELGLESGLGLGLGPGLEWCPWEIGG